MKKVRILVLFVLMVQLFTVVACSKDWVASIDGDKITLEEFNLLYYAQLKYQLRKSESEIDKLAADSNAVREMPYLSREIFLNELIARKLVYNKADKDGLLEDTELKTYLSLQEKLFIQQYYILKKFEDTIVLDQDELAQNLAEASAKYPTRTAQEIENVITSQMKARTLERKAREFTEKLRDEFKVEKNEDVITKLSDLEAKDRPTTGWVVKINGDEISVEDFENYYYAFHKLTASASKEEVNKYASDPAYIEKFPALDRSNFLDMLCDAWMVYEDADKNGFLDEKETKALLSAQEESFVGRFYTLKKFEDKIEVSDDAVARVYEAQQNRFAAMPILQAENMIRNQLVQREMAMKVQGFMESLREAAVIEKNLDLLNKKSDESDKK